MPQSNNFEVLKAKNLAKRQQDEIKKTKSQAQKEIKHELIVNKNTFLSEVNSKLRKVKLLKREYAINQKYDIAHAKVDLEEGINSVSSIKPYIEYNQKLVRIYQAELEFLQVNKDTFASAFALDKMYSLQNAILMKKSKLSYLNKIQEYLNDEESKQISILEYDIAALEKKYNEEYAARVQEYNKVHTQELAKVQNKVDAANKALAAAQSGNVKIKNNEAYFAAQKQKVATELNKIKAQSKTTADVNDYNELASRKFTNVHDLSKSVKNNKLRALYQSKIAKIQAAAEKKIAKVEFKRDVCAITPEQANKIIDEISINSVQIQRKWNNLLDELNERSGKTVYELKHEKLQAQQKAELADFEKLKAVIAPITPFKKLKTAISDFYATHVFGNSISSYMKRFSSNLRKYSMFYIMAVLLLSFAFATNFEVLKANHLISNFKLNTFVFIISMGMLLVIVAGYIDLSAGITYGFVAYMTVKINNELLLGVPGKDVIVLFFSLLIGLAIGVISGFLIGYLKIPAFVATLAMSLIIRGALLVISNGRTLNIDVNDSLRFLNRNLPDSNLGTTASPFFIGVFLFFVSISVIVAFLAFWGRRKAQKYNLVTDKYSAFLFKLTLIVVAINVLGLVFARYSLGTRYYWLFIAATFIGMYIITSNTSFGRKVYAIGGNKVAAELSGINSKRTTFYIFCAIGITYGIAGYVFVSIEATVTGAQGLGQELDVIAAVFVGGASAYGGIGTVVGTIIGGFIMSVITKGLNILNVAQHYQFIVKGLILVGAVGIDVYTNRKIG
ncbi:Ribose ABC transporter [Mycoplasmopsis californica]|uniref:Xylose transport system permease protein XylH n=1 Tax=Mycoplasmopsis equigenitalium TaxID=114883 RepID=A0ABY5J0C3_9BACT|nr:hypothetical protein [Mycoplasmopsis equigenitalium]UUD36704.1 hypothetical protein NPA09_02205 [Mycoplasmopsis equigenitalium]VEU70003.1 Ribose ABC transporter [Mycoplasmopsis californica]